MSLGFGGYARIAMEDDETVLYEYGAYNLDLPEFRNEGCVYDGNIMIPKDCFVEPEIHEKLKRMPSGRKKLIVKRIPVGVDYSHMLRQGQITFENCSNCWQTIGDDPKVDIMICHLLFQIFRSYQTEGKIPSSVSYHV